VLGGQTDGPDLQPHTSTQPQFRIRRRGSEIADCPVVKCKELHVGKTAVSQRNSDVCTTCYRSIETAHYIPLSVREELPFLDDVRGKTVPGGHDHVSNIAEFSPSMFFPTITVVKETILCLINLKIQLVSFATNFLRSGR